MPTPRTTPFAFISLFFLLLHVLVPAIALPVQLHPSFARSLDTPSVQHDTALLKGPHVTLLEAPLFPVAPHQNEFPLRTARIPPVACTLALSSTLTQSCPRLLPRHNTNFGKKVKEGFQNAGRKIKEGFQNFGNKVKQGFQKVGKAFQTVGKKIKQGFQMFGNKVKQGFQKVKQGFQTAGRKIKEGFQTAGRKIKEGFQTAGKKMKEGFIKAGKWIKDNGAKVAKFGLKVWSTVQSVGARIVKYVLPGIGKPISAALQASSQGISMLADKIPAKLDDRLEKGMKVMDKIQHPLSGAAGAVVDKILRRDFPPTSAGFEHGFIEEDELPPRDLHELDERAWDGDFDIMERSWNGDPDLSGRSVSEQEDARSFHVVESKRPLFLKDP